MSFISALNIRAKLLFSFLSVLIISCVVTVTSILGSISTMNSATTVDEMLNGGYKRASLAQSTISTMNAVILDWLNPRNEENSTALYNKYKQLATESTRLVNSLRESYIDSVDFKQAITSAKADSQRLLDFIDTQIVPLVNQNKHTDALALYSEIGTPLFYNVLADYKVITSEIFKVVTKASSEASSSSSIYVSIVLAIISFIIGISFALIISSYISNCLKTQIKALDYIADGNFRFDVDTNKYKDEFGYCLTAISRMKDSLSRAIGLTIQECTSINEKLSDIQKLSNKIVNQTSQAESQSLTVASASDEMVSTTSDIARNCEGAAADSEKSKHITNKGVSTVQTAVSMISKQSEITGDNALKIEALAKQTTEIGSIVSTIDEIAAQTNLLALNAAIEAARAGDAGRGFAVVADEVRALASRTSQSTQEISTMVTNIQTEAKIAADAITQSVSSMTSVAQEAKSVVSILDEITEHVNGVNTQITQIATAAEEQTAATAEISNNMQSITNATQEISKSAQTTHSSINEIKDELDSLRNELNFFKV